MAGLNVVLVRPEDLGDSPDTQKAAAGELLAAIRHFAAERGASAGLSVGSLPPSPLSTAGTDRLALEELRANWARQLSEIDGVEMFDFGGVVERVGLTPAGNGAPQATSRELTRTRSTANWESNWRGGSGGGGGRPPKCWLWTAMAFSGGAR